MRTTCMSGIIPTRQRCPGRADLDSGQMLLLRGDILGQRPAVALTPLKGVLLVFRVWRPTGPDRTGPTGPDRTVTNKFRLAFFILGSAFRIPNDFCDRRSQLTLMSRVWRPTDRTDRTDRTRPVTNQFRRVFYIFRTLFEK